MDFLRTIMTPVLGAIIGYFTNWLAIKMVFRPYEEKRIFGIKVPFTPGLIAVERPRITKQIGYVVSNHLLTDDDLKNSILKLDFYSATKKSITRFLDYLKNSELTIDDVLKKCLKDDYDTKKAELTKQLTESINSRIFAEKDAEQLDVLKGDIKTCLPPTLEIVKTIFDKNLYSIDVVLTGLFEDMIGNTFGSFGPMIASLVNSEKLYQIVQKKVVTSISENPDEIVEKVLNIVENNNNNTKKAEFDISTFVDFSVEKVLSIKLTDISEKLDFLADEKTIVSISDNVRTFLSNEIENAIRQMDIETLITSKIDEMSLSEIEDLILVIAKKEITAITYVGGVLGFIIGFIPVIFR